MLDHATVQETRRDGAPAELARCLRELDQDGALEARQPVAYVGQEIVPVAIPTVRHHDEHRARRPPRQGGATLHCKLRLAVAIALALGCRREEPGRAPHASQPAPAVLDAGRSLPTREERAKSPPAPAGARSDGAAPPPVHGCTVRRTVALGAPFQRGYAGFAGDRPIVVGSAEDGRLLVALDPAASPQRSGARLALADKLARGALHCDLRCVFSYVDERARLLSVALDAAQFDRPVLLARGVDRRFAPALGVLAGTLLVSYTASVGETMHTFLVSASGGAPRDLTPAGHGAAAPTFILGESPPGLVMIDARAGVSPLLEVGFDARGNPLDVRVRTPVSQPSAPPLLAAVALGGEVEVFYRVIGKLAMTAMGRVPLRQARTPTPLFPSRGYGELELSVARGRHVVLVAAEEPTAPPPDSPRTLALKLLDGADTRDVLALGSATQPAARPSLAASPRAGTFLLAYVQASTLYGSVLACDDR